MILVRECQPLSAPDDGQITPEICKTRPLHDQTCSYECSPGYTRTGPSSDKCDNGYWTQGGFHCQGKVHHTAIVIGIYNIDSPTEWPTSDCLIGHFRVAFCLCLKTSPEGQSWCTAFLMEMSFTCTFIVMQIKPISITKVVHQDSFWNRGKWPINIQPIPPLFILFIDKEVPSFGETCPSARSVFADEGKTSATVSWGPVTATDNDQAILTWSPHVASPHVFPEGSHTVIYTATDPAGNTNFCHFQVTVQGKKNKSYIITCMFDLYELELYKDIYKLKHLKRSLTGFEPMAFAIPVQALYHWAMKPLGAGHLRE